MAKAIAVAGDEPNKVTHHVTGLVERSTDFLKDVRNEMRKVVTPSMHEVRSTTIVVIATVFAFAAFFYVVDQILGHVIQSLLHSLGSAQ